MKQNRSQKISYDDKNAFIKLEHAILAYLPKEKKEIVVICIGTDRSTGDSFGPLVGTFLNKEKISNVHIYGNLEKPVHALNLSEHLNLIHQTHPNAFIIAIDAALGSLKSVGFISVNNFPFKPGAAMNKELPFVGDISISGIVNVSGFMDFFVLQNTRLFTVMSMSEITSVGLLNALKSYTI